MGDEPKPTVDELAESGWPYSQGFVAGRDGAPCNNPRRGPARRLWDSGFVAGQTSRGGGQ
jgi:hypothetical protein